MGLRIGAACLAALSLHACVYPYANYTRQELITAGTVEDPSINDLSSARQLVNGLSATLHKARQNREIAHTVLAEVIFYGSLVATYGIAAKEIGARNAGAGLAGLGAVLDSHYSLATQQLALGNAASRADCLQDAMNGMEPDTLKLFDTGTYVGDLGDPVGNSALAALPDDTLSAVHAITAQLQNDLNAANLTASSLKDVQDIADKFSHDAKAASEAKATKPSDQTRANVVSTELKISAKREEIQSRALPAGMPGTLAELKALEDLHAKQQMQAAEEIQRKTVFLQRVIKFSSAAQACTKLAVKAP